MAARGRRVGQTLRWVVPAVTLGTVGLASGASAHVDVVSIDPDGQTVLTDPVAEVTLVLATVAEPVGSGFELVERNGIVRAPTTVRSDDGRTWVLGFRPPIVADSGLRWSLKSADSHLISGSLDLEVEVEEPARQTDVGRAGGSDGVETVNSAAGPVGDYRRVTAGPVALDHAGASPADRRDRSIQLRSLESMSTELDGEQAIFGMVDRTSLMSPDMVAYLGRLAVLIGIMLAIASLVFLTHLLRGTPEEARFLLGVIRMAVALVVAGVGLEVAAQVAAETGSWSRILVPGELTDQLSSRFGLAAALRLLGAFGLATGCQFRRERVWPHDRDSRVAKVAARNRPVAVPRRVGISNHPPPAGIDEISSSWHPMLFRWRVSSAGSGAVFAVLAFLAAAAIDGHTLDSRSPVLSALSSVAHVLAGAIWGGGLVVLLNLLYRRVRAHREVEAVDLAIRFSVVAAASLVVVGLAGLALTLATIESTAQLWTTDWGRLVLAKLALVAVAGLFGAINHFSLVPRLAVQPHSLETARRLRHVISAEIALLALVVVVTTQLVSTAI